MTSPAESIAGARWIDTDRGFVEFVDRAAGADRYFIDTEFHRERTYFPRLALVQLMVGDEIVLVDPTTTDMEPLRELFEGEGCAVFHAAQQDLDVLRQSCSMAPRRMFDTQLAAGFLGFSTPSLVSLVSSVLKVVVPKGDRLTDWLRRPLSANQREYAAADVAYLPAISDHLEARLRERGRLEWASEACDELLARPTGPLPPDQAWLKVKDVRTLRGRSRWVARALAEWRERRAMDLDVPPRHVLADLALLGIAQRCPRDASELAQSRGIDSRQAGGALGRALLEAVDRGIADAATGELAMPSNDAEDLDRALRPAVTLVGAWVAELARREELDPALLGTRSDIVELLRGDQDARMRHGWRASIVGNDVGALLAGRAALTFRHGQGLTLVHTDDHPAG